MHLDLVVRQIGEIVTLTKTLKVSLETPQIVDDSAVKIKSRENRRKLEMCVFFLGHPALPRPYRNVMRLRRRGRRTNRGGCGAQNMCAGISKTYIQVDHNIYEQRVCFAHMAQTSGRLCGEGLALVVSITYADFKECKQGYEDVYS